MTNEELNKALYDKCDKEFDTFIDEVNMAFTDKANSKYPLEKGDEFLSEYAYRYSTYGDILMALEEIELTDEQCKALLKSPDPLNAIYDKWLDTESGYMDSIRDCIESTAEKEIQYSQEQETKISVLVIEPHKEPYTKEISCSLDSLQSEVGGYIEAVYPFEEPVALICNEEGKINGLPLNRALNDDDGIMYDVIAGTMLIVGIDESDFCSLSPELTNHFSDLFKEPENIFLFNGEVIAIKDSDKKSVPVYYENSDYATDEKELDAYRLSFKTNIACKKDLEKLINENYSEYSLKSENVYKQITDKYGVERVNALLATTCNELSNDGRISDENKAWARCIPVFKGNDALGNDNGYYICEKPHVGLVDLVIRQARLAFEKEHSKEKSSLLGKLSDAKENIAPPSGNKSKKKEQSI